MTDTQKLLPAEGKCFIATYGSLRRGQSNFPVNAMGNGVFVGQGLTKENYDLHRYRGCYFPSVSLAHSLSETPVVVEIFEAPTDRTGLEGAYDRLEGYPSFYNRTVVPVVLDDGRELDAWIYHIDQSQSERVEHGDWTKFLDELKGREEA